MKQILSVAVLVFFISCSSNEPTPELVGNIPESLKNKLTHQEGHIPYYFPSREEFGPLSDGKFVGELNGSVIDSGKVLVEIKNGEIANVEILDMKVMAPKVRLEGRIDEIFKGLPTQTITKQTIQVDSVTAATGTSHVFKICVTRALWKASLKDDPMMEYSPY